jgi:hypothetical protein
MHKFWFIHMPKTGGISITQYFEKNKLTLYRNGHESYTEEVHKSLGDVEIFTILRDPVEQVRSFYSYLQKSRETPEYSSNSGFNKMQPFSEWLRNPEPGWFGYNWEKILFPNMYVHFFGYGDFDRAKEVLSKMDVFDTSRLNACMETFTNKHRLPEFKQHDNISNKFMVSKDDVEYIIKQREQDFELCKKFNIKVTE